MAKKYTQEIIDCADYLTLKVMELKRSLTYICAASDMTAPGRKKKPSVKERKFTYHRSLSSEATIEKIKNEENTTDEEEESGKIKIKRKMKLVKSKSEDNQSNYAKLQVTSFGNNRKERTERSYKINFPRNKETQNQDENINNENKDIILVDNCRKRKLLRTRRISDGYVSYDKDVKQSKDMGEIISNKSNKGEMISLSENNVVIPTNVQYLDATTNEMVSSSPVSIFVHTTRKLFTPFASETLDFKTEHDISSNNDQKIMESQEETAQNDNTDFSASDGINQNDSTSVSSVLTQTKLSNPSLENTSSEPNENSSSDTYITNDSTMQDDPLSFSTPIHLPPLPNSPVAQRRERTITKETSPAIRIMIARYNQKLSEQDGPGYKSGGSSGSASPVAWRSPVLERRVKTQSEKYQEEVNKTLLSNSKYSPHLAKKQVQKSASVGVINVVKKQFTIPQLLERGASLESSDKKQSPKLIRGILKSSSVDSLKKKPPLSSGNVISPLVTQHITTSGKKESFVPAISKNGEEMCRTNPIIQERAYKLQKAKEEFFHFQNTSNPSTSGTHTEEIKYPTRNRLSQVSFGSESSCDDMNCAGLLVKSASAGMINIDEESYEQFRPEMHSQGYVSLPRTTKKKDDKFGISSITSKFRKVKMRRSKDSSQMNAISALCRQSLVVDITLNSGSSSENSGKKKDDSNSKSSWLKNPTRLFKPK